MALDERKAVLSWSLYDWANSAFATTVMAGFYPIFFKQYWSVGVDTSMSTARLGFANSMAGVLVALCAPVLGAIADRGTAKKRFLAFFAYMGALMTASLYMVSMGSWVAAIACYVFGSVGFSGGNIFYDALITGVASEKRFDMVSSLGFAFGYLGGGILFAINVWMTLQPETFGFADASEAVRFAFLTVGVWWAVFTVPLLLFVEEPKLQRPEPGFAMVGAGLRQLRDTFREVRRLRTLFLFLAAYWFYIDRVDTIIRMAVDYGLSIGFDSKALILALLITQFVGFPSAVAFGLIGSRIGPKKAIYAALAVYLFVCVWGAFMHRELEFFLLAAVVGTVQGGIQALSRSYYARMIPKDKSAEFFGFYNMLGKFAAVIGPAMMGGFGLLVRQAGYSADTASRAGITSVGLLFLIGGTLLYFVNEEQGREELRAVKFSRRENK
ncbi:MAG: MFS transporter [Deltaproteobacteria bacterium]|nr:MFS transporter [Deltaproteobacteria bacterium]